MDKYWQYQRLFVVYTVCVALSIVWEISAEAADELAEGVGVIHTIAPDRTSVNLTHDPILAIGWPSMTMNLSLSERAKAQMSEIEPGTVIQFTLERNSKGIFQIGDLHTAPAGTTVNAAKDQGEAPASTDHDTMDHGNHGHNMILDQEGMVMNANHDRLPQDCSTISQDHEFKIQVGRRHAAGRPGVIYGYNTHEIRVEPCSRVKITLINDDSVRHQWMMHGLPRYLYPQGMFHLEVSGKARKSGTFIVPSDDRTYLVHCDMPQHMEKGLKGQVVVGKGNGNLSSIPGISGPIRSNFEDDRTKIWNRVMFYALGTSVLGIGLVAFTDFRKPS